MRHCVSGFFLVLVLGGVARSTEPSYLPLMPGGSYAYAWTYEGRSGVDSETVRKVAVDGRPVFYFESSTGGRTSSIIGANGIGLGAYEVRADGIYTRDVFWRNDLEKTTAKDAQLLLPSPLRSDFRTVLRGKDHDVTIVVRGFEDVTVPAGTFKRCLKLGIDAEGGSGTAWLAPGVGLVKWDKATGRKQVLAQVSRPAP